MRRKEGMAARSHGGPEGAESRSSIASRTTQPNELDQAITGRSRFPQTSADAVRDASQTMCT